MKCALALGAILLFSTTSTSQDSMDTANTSLPYHQIPDAPDTYTPGSVAARMLDGLGFRYYWATKDLREEDLNYKPSEDSRTAKETLDHIYGLSKTIINAPQAKPNVRTDDSQLSWDEKRNLTLNNIYRASQMCRLSKEGEMNDFKIIFQRGDNTSEFPFWNMLNGPIADAIYHVGQIVAHRRASGNPIHPGVSMLRGVTKE